MTPSDTPVPATDGIELQDREFPAAIVEGRKPNAGVSDVLPCYRLLAGLAGQLVRHPVPG